MADNDSQLYSRIYHRLMHEYPSVWRSDSQLATYVRLLVLAEKFWPERPNLPRYKGSAIRALMAANLIQVDEDFTYRVRGLDAARTARRNAARNAARVRHAMPSNKSNNNREEKQAVPKAQEDDSLPATFMGFRRPPPRASEASVIAQHNRDFDPCAVCGERRGGAAHAPGRATHSFQEKQP